MQTGLFVREEAEYDENDSACGMIFENAISLKCTSDAEHYVNG